MSIDYGWENRTILGYHSRDNNSYGVITKNPPILTKELDAIFLVTRNHFFTISTPQISNVITNFLRFEKFENKLSWLKEIKFNRYEFERERIRRGK